MNTDPHTALNNLADALVDDVLTLSDAEILAEVAEAGENLDQIVADGRAAFQRAQQRGRPRKPNSRKPLTVYLTDAERAAIDAVRGDIDRSTWMRRLVLQQIALRYPPPQDRPRVEDHP